MGVGAVAIAAIGGNFEYLAEVMSYLLLLHIESAKTLDSRCVNEPTSFGEGKHLREGGGVHACVMAFRYFSRTQTKIRKKGIDEGALAYAGVARE